MKQEQKIIKKESMRLRDWLTYDALAAKVGVSAKLSKSDIVFHILQSLKMSPKTWLYDDAYYF
jgi:hypothetical protein